jgi:hypothetical protein
LRADIKCVQECVVCGAGVGVPTPLGHGVRLSHHGWHQQLFSGRLAVLLPILPISFVGALHWDFGAHVECPSQSMKANHSRLLWVATPYMFCCASAVVLRTCSYGSVCTLPGCTGLVLCWAYMLLGSVSHVPTTARGGICIPLSYYCRRYRPHSVCSFRCSCVNGWRGQLRGCSW